MRQAQGEAHLVETGAGKHAAAATAKAVDLQRPDHARVGVLLLWFSPVVQVFQSDTDACIHQLLPR